MKDSDNITKIKINGAQLSFHAVVNDLDAFIEAHTLLPNNDLGIEESESDTRIRRYYCSSLSSDWWSIAELCSMGVIEKSLRFRIGDKVYSFSGAYYSHNLKQDKYGNASGELFICQFTSIEEVESNPLDSFF